MSHTFSKILIHAVYSTKRRHPFLQDKELRDRLHQYMGGVLKNNGAQPLGINGVEEHVHLVFGIPPSLDVASLIKETKRASSIWVKDQDPHLRNFVWQRGYGAFSISQSILPRVQRYVAIQEEHHRKQTFIEEWNALMRAYGLEVPQNPF